MKRILVLAMAAFALAACTSPRYVVSDVTRFHSLPPTPSGQTFVIATIDAEQGQSLAFRQFADQITSKMVSMGLKPYGGAIEGADLAVTIRYDVRGPTPDIQSRTSSWGFSGGYWGRHAGVGLGWEPDWESYTDTRQMYVRLVQVDMYRGATYNTPKRERVFEGRSISAGQNGQIEPVMPYILDAMFKDFPGRSGETQRVSVQVPDALADINRSGPRSRSSF